MLFYAATIFLSAFLLFQVQPLIAKFILPWFGGSAAVWSVVLLFFQLLLLAGYLYAHCLILYVKPKRQFWVHATLLVVSLATLPIIPSAAWKPAGGGDPTIRILLLLGATVGLPYTLLSATSPLLQAWYFRTRAGALPYRLFALSNFGSMLALLSYRAFVEPPWTLGTNAVIWSSGFAVFAALCALTAWRSFNGRSFNGPSSDVAIPNGPTREAGDAFRPATADTPALKSIADSSPPSAVTMLLWIGFAACASTLLLSVTTLLTQNIAPIPLLWIAPLSLYLLSFILCFDNDWLYNRFVFLPLLAASLGLFTYGEYAYENNADVERRLVPALCAALFVCCMVCHGELARAKPHPRYLTQFYLMVSVGGAAGGLFVALVAPRLFRDYLELPIAMISCAALITCVLWNEKRGWPRPVWIRAVMIVATIGFAGYLRANELHRVRQYVLSARNFYGVLHVRDDPPSTYSSGERVLIHGTIDHGSQFLRPGSDRIPTSYFGPDSGISRGIQALRTRGPLRLGILGLGAGVTAALAHRGDTLHYYEINPLISDIAHTQFGFLRACPAATQLFMGDGRLVLERLPDEHLDFLAMDAFSSDSVPVHLLTREAYKLYSRHLNRDGVMAINISNRYLDLEPVVAQAAAELGWAGIAVSDDPEEEGDIYSASTWVLLSPAQGFFARGGFYDSSVARIKTKRGFRPWTDDYSNLIQILK